jgi:hypothetical protein
VRAATFAGIAPLRSAPPAREVRLPIGWTKPLGGADEADRATPRCSMRRVTGSFAVRAVSKAPIYYVTFSAWIYPCRGPRLRAHGTITAFLRVIYLDERRPR